MVFIFEIDISHLQLLLSLLFSVSSICFSWIFSTNKHVCFWTFSLQKLQILNPRVACTSTKKLFIFSLKSKLTFLKVLIIFSCDFYKDQKTCLVTLKLVVSNTLYDVHKNSLLNHSFNYSF